MAERTKTYYDIDGHGIIEGYGDDRKTVYVLMDGTALFSSTSPMELGLFRAGMIAVIRHVRTLKELEDIS